MVCNHNKSKPGSIRCRSCYNESRKIEALGRTTQTCSNCRTEKPLSAFAPDKRRILGRQSSCRECQSGKSKLSGHVAQRKYRLRRVYGMTLDEYERLFDQQNGRCAGCHEKIEREGRRTHVDHDHETGVVRGILCQDCNSALGYARDDVHRLRGLIHYLEYKADLRSLDKPLAT